MHCPFTQHIQLDSTRNVFTLLQPQVHLHGNTVTESTCYLLLQHEFMQLEYHKNAKAFEISLSPISAGENAVGPCTQVSVHVKESQLVEITRALPYDVSHNDMVVLGC